MNYTQDYLNDILIRIAYHSSGIEGNTISLPETVSIILENCLPNSRKSIREFYEIENHKQAFSYMIQALKSNQPLSLEMIKAIHALLTDRLQHDKGTFKQSQNAIIGADFQTATPQQTPSLMMQWVKNTSYRLNNASNEQDILMILSDTHIQFERIQPFSDGNGRTGRFILMYLSMKYLNAPVVVNKQQRAEYMELLATQNVKEFARLLQHSWEFEKERIAQFK